VSRLRPPPRHQTHQEGPKKWYVCNYSTKHPFEFTLMCEQLPCGKGSSRDSAGQGNKKEERGGRGRGAGRGRVRATVAHVVCSSGAPPDYPFHYPSKTFRRALYTIIPRRGCALSAALFLYVFLFYLFFFFFHSLFLCAVWLINVTRIFSLAIFSPALCFYVH
jgi:hypothetical protein